MNFSANMLSIENMEEKLVTPSHIRLRSDKTKSLIVQEFIVPIQGSGQLPANFIPAEPLTAA
jgi:hypothetical protein